MRTSNTDQGYIALSATLLISAVLLLLLSQSILRSSTSTRTLTEMYEAVEVRTLGLSCAERATQLFFIDSSLRAGTEIDMPQGSCTILAISSTQEGESTLLVHATREGVESTLDITFDTANPEITSTTWTVH